jgi:hypothetical protein
MLGGVSGCKKIFLLMTVLKVYRYIALKPCLSKIIEHLIKNRLYKLCKEKNILHLLQMGGIPKKSTNDALTYLNTIA